MFNIIVDYRIFSVLSFILIGLAGIGYYKTNKNKVTQEIILTYKEMNAVQSKKIKELEIIVKELRLNIDRMENNLKLLQERNEELWKNINEVPFSQLKDYLSKRLDNIDYKLGIHQ